jgi:hypothetical protein
MRVKLDYIRLAWTAAKCVYRTMWEGERTHRPGGWKSYKPDYHFYHAAGHLESWKMGNRKEDHIAHALTRLAMILEAEK